MEEIYIQSNGSVSVITSWKQDGGVWRKPQTVTESLKLPYVPARIEPIWDVLEARVKALDEWEFYRGSGRFE
ncbi:MAG TPA: hypothetical protein VMW38_17090 [Terriglobia bacterium]|nr:hypothetical protein [Terriglobia bacterium]